MDLVSYAQNFEDIRLWRAFSDVEQGRYIDIGTQDPVHDSVSLLFYERGWRGVHVEPTPTYAEAMRRARPDEQVVEAAVSSSPMPITLFEFPNTGLSTGVAEIAEGHREVGFPCRQITVPTLTLARLFDFAGPDFIHWLKIDVEGMEADVLASWGNHSARPAALVIEATAPNTQNQTHTAWHELVLDRGYSEVLFDGLSRYFVHKDHAQRGNALALSPNIFDGFHVAASHFTARRINVQHQAALETARSNFDGARAADAANSAETLAMVEARVAAANLERDEQVANAARHTEQVQARCEAKLADAARIAAQLETALEMQTKARAEERALAQQRLAEASTLAEQRMADDASKLAASAEQIRALQLGNNGLQRDVGRLEGQLEALQAHHSDQMHNERQIAQILVDQLNRSRDDLNHALAEAGKLRGEVERQREAHKAELSATEARHSRNTAAAAARIDALTQEHDQKNLVLADLTVQRDGLANEAERLRQEGEQLRRHIAALESTLQSVTQLIGEEPRLLDGLRWPRRVIARIAIGRGHINAFVSHSAKLAAWKEGVSRILVGLPPTETTVQTAPTVLIDAPSALGNRAQMLEESRNTEVEGPVNSVPRLLAPHDLEFIQTAYRAVLGRDPEPEGREYYLGRLRSGVHKLEIIRQLRRSPEGRTFVPGVAGMDRAIKRHHWANLPLIGVLVRLFTGEEGNGTVHRQLRIIANDLGRLRADQIALLHLKASSPGPDPIAPPPVEPLPIPATPAQSEAISSPVVLQDERVGPPINLDSSERRVLESLNRFALQRRLAT